MANENNNDVSDVQMEELRQQFHFFDVNGSGHIEKEELQTSLKNLGQNWTEQEIDDLIEKVDANKDGKLNFEEFIAWNRYLFVEEMKLEFQTLDTDQSGWLSKAELKTMIQNKYGDVSEETLDDVTYEMDTSQNDKISLDEFTLGMAKLKSGSAYYVLNGEMYIAKMKQDFLDMDQDGNGLIEKSDLVTLAKKLHYGLSEQELETIFNDMDVDLNGSISLDEFIAATVKVKVGES